MKKLFWRSCLGLAVCFILAGMPLDASAKENTIKPGVLVEGMSLSGKTAEEAQAEIDSYVEKLKAVDVTLVAGGGEEVVVRAGDLGLEWANTDLVEQAMNLGSKGNVIARYKALKDLEKENKVFDLELKFDVQAINDILLKNCTKYDVKPENATMERVNGEFVIHGGQTGYALDVETSIDRVNDFLSGDWDFKPCRITLDVVTTQPRGTAEELAQMTDVLGTFSTNYKTSGSNRRANVENGCAHINGTLLYPGEEFSTYKTVSPFTQANGYYLAGSYLNGKVVDSFGGGICQVSTTLYNAVLLAELDVVERNNHSMIVSYVDPSADAAIAESAGKDFRFKNNTDYPIYIEGVTKDRIITFTIYGKETRDKESRKVKYVSEVVEKIEPQSDIIYADAGQPIGYIVSDSAHIGYKAKLWKIVTENGVEVERSQVNSSNYKMSPRSATVGTATSDPQAAEEINAAIASGSVANVKNVIAAITARAAANAVEIGEQ